MGSLSFRPSPKESLLSPITTTSVAPKEEEVTIQEVPFPAGPSEAIAGLLGTCQLPVVLWGEPPIPCHVPQCTLPTRSFKPVNLKGSSKMYICEQCKMHTFNWDSVVSNCLQEHLGICLVLYNILEV